MVSVPVGVNDACGRPAAGGNDLENAFRFFPWVNNEGLQRDCVGDDVTICCDRPYLKCFKMIALARGHLKQPLLCGVWLTGRNALPAAQCWQGVLRARRLSLSPTRREGSAGTGKTVL